MKKSIRCYWLLLFIVCWFNAYTQQYVAAEVNYHNYPVKSGMQQDSVMVKFLKSYTDSVQRSMNQVIGFSLAPLYKKQPEGPLGNFAADAMRFMGEQAFKRKIDVAVINPGGLRSYLPRGEVTLKHIYEIMPFDNLIVLQQMNGVTLQAFLDHTASRGGWGMSGITMQLNKGKADSVYVNGLLLHPDSIYTVANVDYVVNGGDYTTMLKNIPVINMGYLYRDAIIAYIKEFTRQGKAIVAPADKRIVHADQ